MTHPARRIKTLSAPQVEGLNRLLANQHGFLHQCSNIGKIESALHSTFYPGVPPFQHGGIGSIAGAMAFYICQAHAFFDGNKRTAVESAAVFLSINGFHLRYPSSTSFSPLADLIEQCASGKASIEDLKSWFDLHKAAV